MRGQLEGVFQDVELLDLPRLPGMNSPCYLKGPGVPLFSGTGLQEVLGGCLSLQLNEELQEETAGQTSTQRPSGQENGGGAAKMTGPQQPGTHRSSSCRMPSPSATSQWVVFKDPLAHLKPQGALGLLR